MNNIKASKKNKIKQLLRKKVIYIALAGTLGLTFFVPYIIKVSKKPVAPVIKVQPDQILKHLVEQIPEQPPEIVTIEAAIKPIKPQVKAVPISELKNTSPVITVSQSVTSTKVTDTPKETVNKETTSKQEINQITSINTHNAPNKQKTPVQVEAPKSNKTVALKSKKETVNKETTSKQETNQITPINTHNAPSKQKTPVQVEAPKSNKTVALKSKVESAKSKNLNVPKVQIVKTKNAKKHHKSTEKLPVKKQQSSAVSKPKDKISIVDTKIDRTFIRKMEGSNLKGYVPLPQSTQSGVTIADGFDLGQMRMVEFNRLPINSVLKAKLKPYVGLKRFTAKNFLMYHPLTITREELNELNVVSADKDLQPLIKAYHRTTGRSFLELPSAAQTVIFSYAYQYGPYFMYTSGGRQLWHYFTTDNWVRASDVLRSQRMYASRRRAEANLLHKI